MKDVTIKDPDGKWTLTVSVVSRAERNKALRARGIDPRTVKTGRLRKGVIPRIV